VRRLQRLLLAVLLAAVATGAAACRSGTGTRCERVCRAETECAEELEIPDVELSGCIEACGELERDPRTQPLVDDHVRCVARAKGCAELLACP
jgi:hypothetical protein